jgi:hypothetical protein
MSIETRQNADELEREYIELKISPPLSTALRVVSETFKIDVGELIEDLLRRDLTAEVKDKFLSFSADYLTPGIGRRIEILLDE